MLTVHEEATNILTECEKEVLDCIVSFFKNNGYSPSIRELSELLFFNVNTIHAHVERLSKKGFIKRIPRISRGIVLINKIEMQ